MATWSHPAELVSCRESTARWVLWSLKDKQVKFFWNKLLTV